MFAILFPLSLFACVEDVSKDKVEATVSDAKKVDEAKPAAGQRTLVVDPGASRISALGAKVTATHPIEFPDFKGTLDIDAEGKLAGASFTVQMEALTSDDDRLTKHLKNEDFFDVPNHPTSTFTSTSVEHTGPGVATVTGNLTVRGNTKSVSFPADWRANDGMIEAKTEFALDRKDFGVVYPGRADDLVQDKVVLTIQLVAGTK